jgi:hypothetical protein
MNERGSAAAKPIPRTAGAALREDGTADTSLRICSRPLKIRFVEPNCEGLE